jgi:chemotaxis signal transduction protein
LVLARTSSDELQIGLIVDRIRGILGVRSDEAAPVSSSWEGGLRPYLRGVLASQDDRVVLLDLEQLLLSPAMRLAEFS